MGCPAGASIYRQRNLRIRRVLTSLGFQSFTNTGRESVTISTVKVPSGQDVQALYDQLKERGFVIYKAKGPLAADHIQIANMGEISEATLDAFLAALTDVVDAARRASRRLPPAASCAAYESCQGRARVFDTVADGCRCRLRS